jgi:2'-5' RNA ligase
LLPDSRTAVRIDGFRRRFFRANGLDGSPVRAERLHLTLHHIGDFGRLRPKFLFAADRAAGAVSKSRFEVTFRFITSFEPAPKRGGVRRRPLVMIGASDPLIALHNELGRAMEANGLRALQTFMPHMTLSYGPQQILWQPIEPIRFVATEFVLIHSELWLSRYNLVGRWPLTG